MRMISKNDDLRTFFQNEKIIVAVDVVTVIVDFVAGDDDVVAPIAGDAVVATKSNKNKTYQDFGA